MNTAQKLAIIRAGKESIRNDDAMVQVNDLLSRMIAGECHDAKWISNSQAARRRLLCAVTLFGLWIDPRATFGPLPGLGCKHALGTDEVWELIVGTAKAIGAGDLVKELADAED